MARKYDSIVELYDGVCRSMIREPVNWMEFLNTASHNYRMRFDEQVLIFAQRPDATAVLSLEDWNEKFGRWVKKNRKGIALLDDEVDDRQKLRYVFDVRDTFERKGSRPVTIWKMDRRYEDEVLTGFEEVLGMMERTGDFVKDMERINEAIVERYGESYKEAFLKGLWQDGVEEASREKALRGFSELLTKSVKYMVLHRLGMEKGVMDENDFEDIRNFHTKYTFNALGFAVGDIAKMELSMIAKSLVLARKLEKEKNENEKLKGDTEKNGNQLYNEWRLSNTESEITRTDSGANGELREGLQGLSEGAQSRDVLQSVDGMSVERTFDEDRGIGDSNGEHVLESIDGEQVDESSFHSRENVEDSEEHGNGRSVEENLEDDQNIDFNDDNDFNEDFEESLEVFDKRFLSDDVPMFDDWEKIKGMLVDTTTEKDNKSSTSGMKLDDIEKFFVEHQDMNERVNYLRHHMNIQLTGLLMGEKTSKHFYKKYQDGMRFMTGSYLNPKSDVFHSWETIVKGFEEIFDERNQNKVFEMIKKEEQEQSEGLEKFDYKAIVQDHPCKNYIYQENVKRLIFAQAGVPFEFEGKSMQCLSEDLNSIKDFFDKNPEKDMRRVYLKNIFPTGENLICVGDNQERYGFKKYEQGLFIWKGEFENREGYSFEYWNDVVSYYEAIDMLGALSNDHWERAGVDETKENIITDEMIDIALQNGSGFEKGKMRIYEAMLRLDSQKEKADFLKHEYGIGGRSSAVPGFRINQNYDSKGFEFYSSYSDDIRVNLSWSEVSKRIDKLISEDRYLNEEEKDNFKDWLEAHDKLDELKAFHKKEELENWLDDDMDKDYVYDVGTVVYIGDKQYEVDSIDDDKVVLYDFESPLFTQEMNIDEFEEKLSLNQNNKYLLKAVESEEQSLDTQIENAKMNRSDVSKENLKQKEVEKIASER